jgi:hypothetical protein
MRFLKNKRLAAICVLSIGVQVVFNLIFGWVETGCVDTPSYLDAVQSLQSGKLDMLRTPGYPLFLLFGQSAFGARWGLNAVVLIQNVLFLLSIPCFWSIANKVLSRPSAVFLSTAFYACFPATFCWNRMIMTETLSLTMTLFFIHALMSMKERGQLRSGVFSGMLLLGLLLLRPAALYLLPIYVLWCCVCFFDGKRKAAFVGFAFVGTSILALLMYTKEFKKEYGVALTSSVSTQNQYVILRDIHLIDKVDCPRTQFEQGLNRVLEHPCFQSWMAWNEYNDLLREYGLVEMQRYVTQQVKQNKRDYIRRRVDRLFGTFGDVVFHLPLIGKNETAIPKFLHNGCQYSTSWMRFNLLWLICLFGAVILALSVVRRLPFPWTAGLLISLITLNFMIVFLGSPCVYDRLICPSYSAIILLTAFVLEKLRLSINGLS